ncbi:MAG TPA: pyridoxal-dependent decarboxylase [Kofleriaceae bacterium]|nr:pyridoxal-dependent decarboxylase [Kofleriaceae bacterium]
MNRALGRDARDLPILLRAALEVAEQALRDIDSRPAGVLMRAVERVGLPREGLGAAGALDRFRAAFEPLMTGSAGPRYWGFVTGSVTPAALVGDWLTPVFDNNAIGQTEPGAALIEREAIGLLRELLGLPAELAGTFVSGATMANMVGLAQARQWAAARSGARADRDGLYGLPPPRVLSGAAHASIDKALSMLGVGRRQRVSLPLMAGRQAVDVAALASALDRADGAACIVVASAGTADTGDFDDLAAIGALRRERDFWLHVDAAFGGFAACSPIHRHLVDGWESADSITVDCHKWLNVPYDSGVQWTRHRELQLQVFGNSAAYLPPPGAEAEPLHLAPENSRRLRALPAWFTLLAYGADGYREIVERDAALASALGERVAASAELRLLAPVRLNVVCFTLADPEPGRVARFIAELRADGRVFLTPTTLGGVPAARAALSGWRTEERDLDVAWSAILEAARRGHA